MFTNFILMRCKYYLIYVSGSPAEADAVIITICNENVTCVQVIYNNLNHELHINNMYSFCATENRQSPL